MLQHGFKDIGIGAGIHERLHDFLLGFVPGFGLFGVNPGLLQANHLSAPCGQVIGQTSHCSDESEQIHSGEFTLMRLPRCSPDPAPVALPTPTGAKR